MYLKTISPQPLFSRTDIQSIAVKLDSELLRDSASAGRMLLSLSPQNQAEVLAWFFDQGKYREVVNLVQAILADKSVAIPTGSEHKIVLGSTSPRRKFILRDILKLDFAAQGIDTPEFKPKYFSDIRSVTRVIALQKLMALIEKKNLPGGLVLTCDTLVHLKDGTILGKAPGETLNEQIANAKQILQSLLGQKHQIISSVFGFNINTGKLTFYDDVVDVQFQYNADPVLKLIDWYADLSRDSSTGRGPVGKAGSYGLQEPEILSMVRIKGDPFTVIGMPIIVTGNVLSDLGLDIDLQLNRDQLFETLWGSSQWAGKPVKILGETPEDHNFVPMAQRHIIFEQPTIPTN